MSAPAAADSGTISSPTVSTDDADLRKRRLRWQCRRGMRELDLLLLRFVEQGYDRLDDAGQRCFERLLCQQDQLLLAWLMGQQQPADTATARLVAQLRQTPSN